MRRWKSHRVGKGPLPFRYVLLISFVLFILLTAQGLWLVEKAIRPTLLQIAKSETQKIGTEAINDAITKKIVGEVEMEKLIIIDKDQNGDISSVQFDSKVYTKVLSEATNQVQKYVRAIETGEVQHAESEEGEDGTVNQDEGQEGGIVYTIPLGQATKNALLAHLGPKVPVKFTAVGHVKANMSHKLESTGINNTLISLFIDIEVDVKVIIPFATDKQLVETSVPIGVVFVSGKVPEFYSPGGNGPTPAIIKEEDIKKAVDREN